MNLRIGEVLLLKPDTDYVGYEINEGRLSGSRRIRMTLEATSAIFMGFVEVSMDFTETEERQRLAKVLLADGSTTSVSLSTLLLLQSL